MTVRRFHSPEPDAGARARSKIIMTAIQQGLPEREREAMVRFYFDGETEEEIAATIGVYSQRLRMLRQSVKQEFLRRTGAAVS
jgi:DNA-directed RNA polymerase specialized sigma subunit